MRTGSYPHKIAAIYPDAQAADAARTIVEAAGLGDIELVHLHADSPHIGRGIEPEQAATRNRFIQDIVVGTGIGTAVGAAGAGAIALALPSLFVSVPVVGPLMVAGYGASLGMTAGAVKALKVKEGLLSGMVQDAIKAGFHVLIVHSADDATHARAEAIVGSTLAEDTASV